MILIVVVQGSSLELFINGKTTLKINLENLKK